MEFMISINGLLALIPVILVCFAMPTLLRISKNEQDVRFRILPVLVAAGWCTILSRAFGLKSGLIVSIVLIACVFVSLQVPTVIVSKMFGDKLEGVALAVNFVVSAGLSSFCVLFVVGKYQLILLPKDLWLAMAFGTIAFVFWIHFYRVGCG